VADEFRFTCGEGHSWVSANKIRSFCPECGKSTRRVAALPGSDEDKPKEKPRAISIKHVTRPKSQPPPEPPKEPDKVPAKRNPPPRKPATKSAPPKTTVARKSAPPLTQQRVAKRVSPPVAKKMPRTTKQVASKTKEEETMFTRMRKQAFGR
jgi:type IV secretory pathway VirB10-like protein